jgi:hypothetical protein
MRLSFALVFSAAVLLPSCFFEDDSPPPLGTLLVDWTVAGSKRALTCADFSADSIDVVIRTHDGLFVDEFTEYCESFQTSVDLSPGTYVVDAVLLDAGGSELTTPVTDRLRVYRWETSVSALDFPAASFY